MPLPLAAPHGWLKKASEKKKTSAFLSAPGQRFHQMFPLLGTGGFKGPCLGGWWSLPREICRKKNPSVFDQGKCFPGVCKRVSCFSRSFFWGVRLVSLWVILPIHENPHKIRKKSCQSTVHRFMDPICNISLSRVTDSANLSTKH